ncbi:DNA phosphorothioation-dependent restriction protein DptF [Aliikangiella sp. IMCC44632]
MNFQEALSVLSKSSPYAVSTERKESISLILDEVKSYLYVTTEIEKDFYRELLRLKASEKKILFICGSSGDGKSEILTRYSKKFTKIAKFHLDATHSFAPDKNAIQTLDALFEDYKRGKSPLVIGINTGMLGNYAQEGCSEEIKNSIKNYLDDKKCSEEYLFFNFESYPKFQLNQDGHASNFIRKIFDKITASKNNVIRGYFEKEDKSANPNRILCTNYKLLCIPEVQERIIDVLFKARLMKDQFLTARTLLDFIHTLLLGSTSNGNSGYLFDNLFEESDNELSSKIIEFDPANHRTNTIDKFVLSCSLGLPDSEFEEYADFLSTEFGIPKSLKSNPYSYLRLFYILKNTELSNQYHSKFYKDFSESLLIRYSKMWNVHNFYNGDLSDKVTLRKFYRETIFTAVQKYNNRNAHGLDKGMFLISEHNGYKVATELELKVDLDAIKTTNVCSPSLFNLHLKLNDSSVKIPMNINLLYLMESIVKGYRPNKHDKNTVVLLDELVEKISEIATNSNTLIVINNNNRFKVTNVDDEDIEVSGVY